MFMLNGEKAKLEKKIHFKLSRTVRQQSKVNMTYGLQQRNSRELCFGWLPFVVIRFGG